MVERDQRPLSTWKMAWFQWGFQRLCRTNAAFWSRSSWLFRYVLLKFSQTWSPFFLYCFERTNLNLKTGQRLARMELRIMIIMLVFSFEFEPIPDAYASFRADEVINRGPEITYIQPVIRTWKHPVIIDIASYRFGWPSYVYELKIWAWQIY